jgi:hypothetical protein
VGVDVRHCISLVAEGLAIWLSGKGTRMVKNGVTDFIPIFDISEL